MDLIKLSQKRIKDAQKKYGNNWMDFSKEDLVEEIEAELADTISYLTFYEKLFLTDLTMLKDKTVELYNLVKGRLVVDEKQQRFYDFNINAEMIQK